MSCIPAVLCKEVAILDDSVLSAAVGARGGPIWFSAETARKQRRVHPELSDADYTETLGALSDCEVVKEGRNGYNHHLLFLIKRGERHAWRWWKVAVKATEDGNELYLVTLHPLES